MQTSSLPSHETECLKTPMLFPDLGPRKVVADFTGGHVSSDGGVLLLQQVDRAMGFSRMLASCFSDQRKPDRIEHRVEELIRQRLFGLALGYEDLNDHTHLGRDPLLAAAIGKEDVLGENRRNSKDRGFGSASAATLNRLELGVKFKDQYRKIQADMSELEKKVLKLGVRCLPKDQELFILDFDATDDPLHGKQEGRFFHGFYDAYCYLPLYCFCGNVVLWAQLRTSDQDSSNGTVEALEKIVAAIRERIPKAKILVRADSGFSREEIMKWCEEQHEVYYAIGLARNERLERMVQEPMEQARARYEESGEASREYAEVQYQTLASWSCTRRVLCKAEVVEGGKSNPRFVTTNITAAGIGSRSGGLLVEGGVKSLYEKIYCGRGESENQLKQMVLDLHADRTSSCWFASNQLRLWFTAIAYLLVERVRTIGMRATNLANATLGTVRLRMLKLGAIVEVSVRRVHVRLSSAFGLKREFREAVLRLAACGEPLTD